MGRLFWKFFFAFALSLLVAAAGVAAAVWFQQAAREALADDALVHGPRTAMRLAAAAAVGASGGAPALRRFLQDDVVDRGPPLLAVDDGGNDVLGRPVPTGALANARAAAADLQRPPGRPRGPPPGTPRGPAARTVSLAGGGELLLFVPALDLPAGLSERRPMPRPIPPALLLAIGIASSLVFAALLAWYFARPVRALGWALASAAKGDLGVRVGPRIGARRDEIADLGVQFDAMIRQIQALVEAQRRLFHDVSHELRSPLARLDVAVGLARRDPARIEQSLERIERESARLDALIGQLLTLARLESGANHGPRQSVDLAALVAGVVDDAAFEGEQRAVRIDYRSAGPLEAAVHADLLHSALDNVLRNALRHAPDRTTVDVSMDVLPPAQAPAPGAPRARTARISIADRGPGLAPDELESVFRPFVRGASGARAPGFGLGLAIAARAVEAHGGTIRARAREGGGLVVEIELPVVPADATPSDGASAVAPTAARAGAARAASGTGAGGG
jgi:two-component system OmpR family sensor kinase